MHPADIVEIARKIHVARVAPAGLLCSAECLRIENADRRLFDSRSPLGVTPSDIEPRVDEEPPAERTHLLRAKRVVLVLRNERALGLVVSADALVFVDELPTVEAEPQRLIARRGPVEVRVDEHEFTGHTVLERLDAGAGRTGDARVRRLV